VGAGVAANPGEAVLQAPAGEELVHDLGNDRPPVSIGGSEALVPDQAQLAKQVESRYSGNVRGRLPR
jgi:hypothetical protein